MVSQAQPLLRPCSHPCIVQRRQGSSLAIIMQGAYTIFSSLASLCKIIVVNFNRLYCTRLVDREISTYSSCYVSTMYTLIFIKKQQPSSAPSPPYSHKDTHTPREDAPTYLPITLFYGTNKLRSRMHACLLVRPVSMLTVITKVLPFVNRPLHIQTRHH